MSEQEDNGIGRRKFLGAAAAAATAGCIGDDKTEGSGQPQNPASNTNSNETPKNSTESNPNSPTEDSDQQQTTPEQSESQVETEIEEQLSNDSFEGFDGLMWCQVPYDNLNIPDSAVSPSDDLRAPKPEEAEAEDLYSYEQLVQLVGDDIDLDEKGFLGGDSRGIDMNSYFIGFTEVEEEPVGEPYRFGWGQLLYTNEDGDEDDFAAIRGGGAFEEGAFETFLEENVDGVSDYSEDLSDELLEYAQS